MKKLLTSTIILTTTAALSAKSVFADYQLPAFTTCTNPQGSLIANYDNGMHAIAGQDGLENGSDSVYSLDTNLTQVTQCYCPTTADPGIQTNWLQVSNLSDEEIQQLENSGWIYIANGSGWGLSNNPYMAKNSRYVCTASALITAVVQSVNVSAPSNNNTNTSSSGSTPLHPGSAGQALPNTGGSAELFEYIGVGTLLLAISYLLKKIAA
jgi:hypothetical protein